MAVTIWVDADACPVKEETVRVARRHGLRTVMVSDGGVRPSQDPMVEMVFVAGGPDAADDRIAEEIAPADICVTSDIPLAARCLERGAFAIRPNGERFSESGIGMALAQRELMQSLRETGAVSGGPRPFAKADRSAFLNALEVVVQAAKRKAAAK
jgi:uncharacterized protein YaiI (UPF0178 family)